jgi:predicted nucleotidyltransferase
MAELSKNAEQLIESIREKLIAELNPRRIVLFGSRARGSGDSESDIDLLIEMETDDPYPDRVRKVSALFRPRDWSLDAFVFTPEEVAASKDTNGNLINIIEREGKVLYERR